MNPAHLLRALHEFCIQLKDNRKRLHRVAYSWCRDAQLADDLVQETLYKALRGLPQLRNADALRSWLFDILMNCWRDHLRRHKETEDILSFSDHLQFSLPCIGEKAQEIARVRSAVLALPMWQREIIALVDLEGFSYAEAAQLLQIPEGTVRSRICRAREALREHLLDFEMEQTTRETNKRRRVK